MSRPRCLLPLLPVLLASCLSTAPPPAESRPGWIDLPGSHSGYPPDLYLIGVGSAQGVDEQARAASHQRALAAIIASIQVEVQATVELDSLTRQDDEHVSWSQTIAESIRVSTQREGLPGAELVETHRSMSLDETATLVCVRREQLLDAWLPEVTSALAQAEALLADTGGGAAPGRAIRNALQAYAVLASAYGPATRAAVVGAPAPFGRPAEQAFATTSALLVEASRRLATAAAALHIVKLSGDGQIGSVRGELPEPLRVRVELEASDGTRRPLPGLPMDFIPGVEGSASIQLEATTTDASGQVAARVSDLGPTGKGSNTIVVRPDFGRLLPALDVEAMPSETFSYLLPTPGQTRVLVSIVETFDRGALPHPVLAEHIADHLSAFGFDARTEASQGLAPAMLAGRRPEELRQLVGETFDYVIRGTAHARISSRDQGLVWFRADAQLQVVELASGLSQVVSTGEVRQAHVDDGESGAVRVMRALQGELRARLEDAFVGLFLPPRPPRVRG